MGKRGPQAKPTHLRLLEGVPGHRPLNDREPQVPTVQELPPPQGFEGLRAEIWKEVTSDLATMKGLSPVDTRMLMSYVDVLYRLILVGKQLDLVSSYSATLTDLHGRPRSTKTLPEFQQYLQLTAQALKMAQNFGMTPSARARIVFFGNGGGKRDEDIDPFD